MLEKVHPISTATGNTFNGRPEPWALYSGRQRWTYLGILFFVAMFAFIDRDLMAVIIEPIKAEFNVSDTMLGLLTGGAFAVSYAALGFPVARWADRGDRRFIIALALAVWSAMTVVCGMTTSIWQLVAARAGVGAGEVGAMPQAQSLIADYFPPERRALAFGVFLTSFIPAMLLVSTIGAQIAQDYGWRALLLVVGVPGIMFALVVHSLLNEPRQVLGFPASSQQESFKQALKVLFAKRSYVNILIGVTLFNMALGGAQSFLISFAVRTHGMSLAGAAAATGVIVTIGGLLGSLLGGSFADRLAARDPSRLARIPGWGMLLIFPILLAAFATNDWTLMLALLLAGMFIFFAVGPSVYAAFHAVCGSSRRATAAVIVQFCSNLIGLGIGPVMAGSLSDWFSSGAGSGEGLRRAIMVCLVLFVPAGLFLLRAGSMIKQDIDP